MRQATQITLFLLAAASCLSPSRPASATPERPGQTAAGTPAGGGAAQVETPPTAEEAEALGRRLDSAGKALQELLRSKTGISILGRRSLQAELERLQDLLRSRAGPACNPAPEIRRLELDLQRARAGQEIHLRSGLHRLAYRSPLDGRLHTFALYAPPGFDAGKRYPLVVMLHGMGTGSLKALGRLFGLPDSVLTDARLTCDRPDLPPRDVLVVAPGGLGDSLYRLAGEADVYTVVGLALRAYPVDRRRVTITGLSMGGTGAVEIALQHPHLYAGVVALCGYYDRRLDSQSAAQPLLPWETRVMSVHSATDWAENGQGIPLVLLHGEQDGPERSRAMQKRYEELGLPVTLEIHPTGHSVWEPGYKDGRAFELLRSFRKGALPRLVTFTTGRPRIRQGHWVTIERFLDHGRWARVRAEVAKRTRVKVTTDNVAALRLDLPAPYLSRTETVRLTIDDTELELEPGRARWVRRVDLVREGQAWRLVPQGQGTGRNRNPPPAKEPQPALAPALHKRPGLSGPIEDLYFEPVVVVYGTGGGQAKVLRAAARRLARPSFIVSDRPVHLRYPVVADSRFSDRRYRDHAVILVGNEATNSVLARLGPRMPVRITAQEVLVGRQAYRSTAVGAIFIHPDPESPERYVLVAGGTAERSYELLRYLPIYLPDYVVFDEQITTGPRRRRTILGEGRSLVTGGWFDESWSLPPPQQKD